MRKSMKKSFIDLVMENKQELLKDRVAMDRIEEKLEQKRMIKKAEQTTYSLHFSEKLKRKGGNFSLSNPKRKPQDYVPNHIGTQQRSAGGNKGKKMQDQSGEHAQVMQTKGE